MLYNIDLCRATASGEREALVQDPPPARPLLEPKRLERIRPGSPQGRQVRGDEPGRARPPLPRPRATVQCPLLGCDHLADACPVLRWVRQRPRGKRGEMPSGLCKRRLGLGYSCVDLGPSQWVSLQSIIPFWAVESMRSSLVRSAWSRLHGDPRSFPRRRAPILQHPGLPAALPPLSGSGHDTVGLGLWPLSTWPLFGRDDR